MTESERLEIGRQRAMRDINERIQKLRSEYPAPGKRLVNVRTDPLLWEAFKAQCTLYGVTASYMLNGFMEYLVEENADES